jgi:hypothetical protein
MSRPSYPPWCKLPDNIRWRIQGNHFSKVLPVLGTAIAQSVQWLGHRLDDRDSIPGRGRDSFFLPSHSDHITRCPSNFVSKRCRGFLLWV